MISVIRIDRAEDVELHLMFLQQPDSLHDPGRMSHGLPCPSDRCREVLWDHPCSGDKEIIFMKEPAPLVIEEDTIGLEGVLDPGVPGL